MTRRIFFGISLPDRMKRKLAALHFDDEFFVKQRPQNLHITVLFVGNVTDDELQRLCQAEIKPSVSSFEVHFGSLAVFPLAHGDNGICLSIDCGHEFDELRSQVKGILRSCAIEMKHIDYRPHVTLGWTENIQLNRQESELLDGFISDPFRVEYLSIFESFGFKEQKMYRRIRDIRLGG